MAQNRIRGPVLPKGNIVKEYIIDGIRVRISDWAYAGKTEAELDEVRRRARQVAQNIMNAYAARMQKENEQNGC